MSGDHGAAVAVPAALDVLSTTPDLRLLIVGRRDVVRPLVAGADPTRCTVVEASEVVAWTSVPRTPSGARRTPRCESPSTSSRRRGGGLRVGGNTGALLATSRFVLGMVPASTVRHRVRRAGGARHTVMLDLGANPDCTAEHLVQFAGDGLGDSPPTCTASTVRGSGSSTSVRKRSRARTNCARRTAACPPRRSTSGASSRATSSSRRSGRGGHRRVLRQHRAQDHGRVARFIGSVMREEFTASPLRKLGALAASRRCATQAPLDPGVYNGASMVGLAGVVIKSHGGADVRRLRAPCAWRSWRRARRAAQIGALMASVAAPRPVDDASAP